MNGIVSERSAYEPRVDGRHRLTVETAPHAGFCFGVRRAVNAVEECLARGEKLCTLGRLIHNEQVVSDLAARGAKPVERIEDIDAPKVAIRSHGIGMRQLESLKARGVEILDLTCPYVEYIHKLVRSRREPVLVIGKRDHPEVEGICGWCGEPYVVACEADVESLPPLKRAYCVAQTTFDAREFERLLGLLQARIPALEYRNTICSTSEVRQSAARELSERADCMIVVGGRGSSNTRRLYDICRDRVHTLWIETARELPAKWDGPWGLIGITAGASTPDGTFKEVVTHMNDIEQQGQEKVLDPNAQQQETDASQEADFAADFEKTLVTIRPGQTITGTVVQITDDEVCVNIGYKSDGLVKKSELVTPDVKIGDELEVEVVKVNDGEGNVLLSQRNIVNRKNWDALMAAYDADEYIDAVGKEAVKGGLIATAMGVRAFVPASQLSQRYVEKIEDFVGKEMKLKIIEVDKTKKRIVASRKEVLKEEEAKRKSAIWDALIEGSIVKGIVRRLTDFGAFVDIGGVDGLVHVTDLSWGRVKHPSDVVSINQEIDVKIQSLDHERERISLSYKATQPKPWDTVNDKYVVGSIVEGKVVRITTFGAFVELEPGLDGLVHISQCALTRIAKVEDAVQVGDIVRVKILDINPDAKRISLSIRAALEDEAFEGVPEAEGESFGDEYAIGGEDTLGSEAPVEEAPVEVAPVAEEAPAEPEA